MPRVWARHQRFAATAERELNDLALTFSVALNGAPPLKLKSIVRTVEICCLSNDPLWMLNFGVLQMTRWKREANFIGPFYQTDPTILRKLKTLVWLKLSDYTEIIHQISISISEVTCIRPLELKPEAPNYRPNEEKQTLLAICCQTDLHFNSTKVND